MAWYINANSRCEIITNDIIKQVNNGIKFIDFEIVLNKTVILYQILDNYYMKIFEFRTLIINNRTRITYQIKRYNII